MLQFVKRNWKLFLQEKIDNIWTDVPVVEEKKLELEEKNFQVDSTGWTKKIIDCIPFLVSPCGGILEYLYTEEYPELTGEQLFTWEAAMRETKKVGKRIPTDDEFLLFEKKDFGKIVYAGNCSSGGSSCNYRGDYAYYWSSTVYSPSPTLSWNRYLVYSSASVYRNGNGQSSDFSVRCLKD